MDAQAVTVVCVLRSGGEFEPKHVYRLQRLVAQYAPGIEFACLTDMPEVLPHVPRVFGIRDRWPGWWSKVELFRIPGPLLYMDLDVTPSDDLGPMLDAARERDFVICRDFQNGEHVVNSSIMAWRGDVSRIYHIFRGDPDGLMARYGDRHRWRQPGRGWGDQGFIRDHMPERTLWQDILPGAVLSAKEDSFRPGCRVLVSHGRPRPWE